MKIEIEGAQDEVMAIMAVFSRGITNTTARAESVVIVTGPSAPEVAGLEKPVGAKPVEVKPADGRPEGEQKPGGEPLPAAEKPTAKRTASKKAAEQVAEVKPTDPQQEPSAETPTPEPEGAKPQEPSTTKPTGGTLPVGSAGSTVKTPHGWETWSAAKRRVWVMAQKDLAPSEKFVLLADAPAPDAEVPPVNPNPEADKPEAEKPTPPAAEGAVAGESTIKLPDWGKWSLAKKIVWVTSLNAADTNSVVGLLEFRKEVGDVNEDNLQVARRKLQIAMRMRDQIENGKKA